MLFENVWYCFCSGKSFCKFSRCHIVISFSVMKKFCILNQVENLTWVPNCFITFLLQTDWHCMNFTLHAPLLWPVALKCHLAFTLKLSSWYIRFITSYLFVKCCFAECEIYIGNFHSTWGMKCFWDY